MKRIYTTTLRLNLEDEDAYRAYEHLRRLDKKQYRSVSQAVIAAVNDYFDRQKRLADDPYLETREKEDAFLQRVIETIQASICAVPVMLSEIGITNTAPTVTEQGDEDLTTALDFADSF